MRKCKRKCNPQENNMGESASTDTEEKATAQSLKDQGEDQSKADAQVVAPQQSAGAMKTIVQSIVEGMKDITAPVMAMMIAVCGVGMEVMSYFFYRGYYSYFSVSMETYAGRVNTSSVVSKLLICILVAILWFFWNKFGFTAMHKSWLHTVSFLVLSACLSIGIVGLLIWKVGNVANGKQFWELCKAFFTSGGIEALLTVILVMCTVAISSTTLMVEAGIRKLWSFIIKKRIKQPIKTLSKKRSGRSGADSETIKGLLIVIFSLLVLSGIALSTYTGRAFAELKMDFKIIMPSQVAVRISGKEEELERELRAVYVPNREAGQDKAGEIADHQEEKELISRNLDYWIVLFEGESDYLIAPCKATRDAYGNEMATTAYTALQISVKKDDLAVTMKYISGLQISQELFLRADNA